MVIKHRVNLDFFFKQTNNQHTQNHTPIHLTSLTQETSTSTTGKTTYLVRQDKTRQNKTSYPFHSTHIIRKGMGKNHSQGQCGTNHMILKCTNEYGSDRKPEHSMRNVHCRIHNMDMPCNTMKY